MKTLASPPPPKKVKNCMPSGREKNIIILLGVRIKFYIKYFCGSRKWPNKSRLCYKYVYIWLFNKLLFLLNFTWWSPSLFYMLIKWNTSRVCDIIWFHIRLLQEHVSPTRNWMSIVGEFLYEIKNRMFRQLANSKLLVESFWWNFIKCPCLSLQTKS